jgi:vacuolar-type H+-ATPase subunit E/Vma4
MKLTNSSIYEKIENKGATDAKEIYRIGQEKAKEIEESNLGDARREVEVILNKAQKRSDDVIKTKLTQINRLPGNVRC